MIPVWVTLSRVVTTSHHKSWMIHTEHTNKNQHNCLNEKVECCYGNGVDQQCFLMTEIGNEYPKQK